MPAYTPSSFGFRFHLAVVALLIQYASSLASIWHFLQLPLLFPELILRLVFAFAFAFDFALVFLFALAFPDLAKESLSGCMVECLHVIPAQLGGGVGTIFDGVLRSSREQLQLLHLLPSLRW